VQIGERDGRAPGFAWPDVNDTAIERIDVLDAAIMPAVDSPGPPRVAPDDLVLVLSGLLPDRRCAGVTVTVFDSAPDRRYRRLLAGLPGRLPFR